MKADGAVNVDYSIHCYNCEKPLRAVDGTDIEDIYSDEDGEDICEACRIQHVEPFEVTDKDGEVIKIERQVMLTKTLKFSDDVLSVLRNMTWSDDGTIGYLHGQLDRKLYVATNKALTAMGGKWNRSKNGHVFATDPRAAVEGLLDDGALTVESDGFFETPKAVVERMTSLVWPSGRVLEPSAGMGAILDNLPMPGGVTFFAVERNADRCATLERKGYGRVTCGDFLEYKPTFVFDTIFMNPPFEASQDIAHVMRAYSLLADDGKMVAIMGEGAFFREDSKATMFRDWLNDVDGWSEQLPDGSFKESGTGVATRIVVIEK